MPYRDKMLVSTGDVGVGSVTREKNNKKREYEENIELNYPSQNTGLNYPFQTNPVLNTQELAKSPYGELSLTKYLYETRLQNIFDDYQKSLNVLESQEKSALQDAYYIRELSKKYLGEYASNVGIGDVSGSLLDIYSNYQRNVADIKSQTMDEKLNLMREYQQTRLGMLDNILYTQFQIDVAKLQEQEQDIIFNVAMGQTDGLSTNEYLDKMFKEGKISKPTYYALKQSIQMQELTKIDETIGQKYILNEQGEKVENPNYIGDDYDFKKYVPGEKVDKTSYMFQDAAGNRFFQVKTPADLDEKYTKSSAELMEEWKAQNPDRTLPSTGDRIFTWAEKKVGEDYVGESVQYVFVGNTWYRLVQEKKFLPEEERLKNEKNKQKNNSSSEDKLKLAYDVYKFLNNIFKSLR